MLSEEFKKINAGTKGQLISKCPFGNFNSPKKWTKKFDFTSMALQVELFLFIELKTPKIHSEINWSLGRNKKLSRFRVPNLNATQMFLSLHQPVTKIQKPKVKYEISFF